MNLPSKGGGFSFRFWTSPKPRFDYHALIKRDVSRLKFRLLFAWFWKYNGYWMHVCFDKDFQKIIPKHAFYIRLRLPKMIETAYALKLHISHRKHKDSAFYVKHCHPQTETHQINLYQVGIEFKTHFDSIFASCKDCFFSDPNFPVGGSVLLEQEHVPKWQQHGSTREPICATGQWSNRTHS